MRSARWSKCRGRTAPAVSNSCSSLTRPMRPRCCPRRASARLLRPFRGARKTSVVRKTVYTFHARVADHWRRGRVFLAGDAAHLTPPYAGQGMNSGVRDAHGLGWKLAAVLRGAMGPSTLDSYEAEAARSRVGADPPGAQPRHGDGAGQPVAGLGVGLVLYRHRAGAAGA
ncbi:FAD-dependent monooxygenase [Cupriavidus basilensis]